ncbi:hypothetical protein N474_22625 [Pseudoalteromonas luteoviolacea CPMOR-2]|uniref:hypothetical protein n=1 Tax=Pseudoalteromonas luteoviolacea TaxID=43657 RepID=UPI0007B0567F|nr:hypothetical protein [Pseudoalteromonas luteoviolacea]KZN52768.1 hypothetical protein N474_22625 [Pseudoalteromonas luteoviolacea CPMOR-2]
MEIVQKKRSVKHTFTFEKDHFNFAYKDKSGSGDTDFNYADFPKKCIIKIEQNDWLRNVGFLWIALGAIQLGYAIYSQSSLSGQGFWLMVGLACVAWTHFSKVKYSVYQAERGNIFVIQNKEHDKIVNELNQRRSAQLLDWYGEINPENELENEINKFKWLADQNVMTTAEAEAKIAQVEWLHKENSDNPSQVLN